MATFGVLPSQSVTACNGCYSISSVSRLARRCEAREVKTITPGNADDFKQWLVSRKLAPTTIHKRLQVARSFFHAMKRRKLLGDNPFEGVKSAAVGIKDRQRFVTREETGLVLA